LETPETQKNQNKSGSLFSRPRTKPNPIIQDEIKKVNTKDQANYKSDWDESFDYGYEAISEKDTPKFSKTYNNKGKTRIIKPIIMVFCMVLIMFAMIYYIYIQDNPNEKFKIPITVKNTSLPLGERKLTTPLLGETENINSLKPNDALSKIDFDFSVIMGHNISRNPMLPNKIIKPDVKTNASEFQNLWTNGTNASQTNISDSITKKTASDYLPSWRRFATEYPPTEGLPIFSIILEYDPMALNVDALPIGKGYNIALPGFLENSELLVKTLREKNYEILLYLPMGDDAKIFNFKAITKNSNFDEIREAVAFHTSQLGGKGFVGFMNYGGKIVQNTLSKMNFMMSLLAKTGYLYIDDIHENEKSLGFAAAEGQKVPTLKTSTYINSVDTEFSHFLKQVTIDGTGIAVVKATQENLTNLKKYEAMFDKYQIRLVPVTGILKQQELKKSNSYLF
jgi:polysaccharide deacetylase 2 family uncharacterized protein YibQ